MIFQTSSTISTALKNSSPIVALESSVITHGLPSPHNIHLAIEMETAILAEHATPASIAILNGQIRVGLTTSELETLSTIEQPQKISDRDIVAAIVKKASGGTTVAGTLAIAHRAGLKVFATGGIGGIHRGNPFDISPDLRALSEYPLVLVCSGPKTILDLPASYEHLESLGIPVIGYQTNELPAFFSRDSGLRSNFRLDRPEEIADFALIHWKMIFPSAIVVVNPIPSEAAIELSELEPIISSAMKRAKSKSISGQDLTPFLLQDLVERTGKRTLNANISLLINNAHLAGKVAVALQKKSSIMIA